MYRHEPLAICLEGYLVDPLELWSASERRLRQTNQRDLHWIADPPRIATFPGDLQVMTRDGAFEESTMRRDESRALRSSGVHELT